MKSQCAGRSMPAAHPGQGGKGSASVNILFDAFAFTVAAPATRPSSGPTTVHTLLRPRNAYILSDMDSVPLAVACSAPFACFVARSRRLMLLEGSIFP